jgi:hypothetical protein
MEATLKAVLLGTPKATAARVAAMDEDQTVGCYPTIPSLLFGISAPKWRWHGQSQHITVAGIRIDCVQSKSINWI